MSGQFHILDPCPTARVLLLRRMCGFQSRAAYVGDKRLDYSSQIAVAQPMDSYVIDRARFFEEVEITSTSRGRSDG